MLVPVGASLAQNAAWTQTAYGAPQPSRGILLAIYAAILAVSALALATSMREAAAGLLLVQIIYKFLSPFTVGALSNPVIVSNLAIAAFHVLTLSRIGLRTP